MSELLDSASKLGLKCPICQSTRAYVATDGKHQFAYCLACKIKLEPQVALDKEVAKGRRQESQNELLEIISRNSRKIGIVIAVLAISFGAKTSLDSREASRDASELAKQACKKWPTFTGIEFNDEASINEASTLFSDAADLDSKYTGVSGGAWRVSSFVHDRTKYINSWGALNDPLNYSPNFDYGSPARAEVRESMASVTDFCKSEGWPMNESNPIPGISSEPSPASSSASLTYLVKDCATIEIGNYKAIFSAGNAYTTCEMVTPFQDSILSGSEIQTTVTARVLIDATKQTYKEVTLYAYLNGPMDNISITYTSRKPIDMNAFMESVLNYDDSLLTENDILIFLVQQS